MLIFTPTGHQTNLFGNDLIQQLDPEDPLLQLAQALPWAEFEAAFSKHSRNRQVFEAPSAHGRIAITQATGKLERGKSRSAV